MVIQVTNILDFPQVIAVSVTLREHDDKQWDGTGKLSDCQTSPNRIKGPSSNLSSGNLTLTTENHHFQWVNPLCMAIFNSLLIYQREETMACLNMLTPYLFIKTAKWTVPSQRNA